jgi:hypothetical protein
MGYEGIHIRDLFPRDICFSGLNVIVLLGCNCYSYTSNIFVGMIIGTSPAKTYCYETAYKMFGVFTDYNSNYCC